MPSITIDQTVGQLVTAKPSRSRLFEKLGIDYCCGGKISLDQACRAKGLDPATIVAVLQSGDGEAADGAVVDAAAMSLTQLADHIEHTHHAYLHEELPRLGMLTEKVARVHGPSDSRLAEVAQIYANMRAELETHMMKEERVLFPAVRMMEAAAGRPQFGFGSLRNPIGCMEHEHDDAGNAIAAIRQLTDDFTPPAHACNTYRAMLDGLSRFEKDLHQHVHKENNILFPRAIELEARRQG